MLLDSQIAQMIAGDWKPCTARAGKLKIASETCNATAHQRCALRLKGVRELLFKSLHTLNERGLLGGYAWIPQESSNSLYDPSFRSSILFSIQCRWSAAFAYPHCRRPYRAQKYIPDWWKDLDAPAISLFKLRSRTFDFVFWRSQTLEHLTSRFSRMVWDYGY